MISSNTNQNMLYYTPCVTMYRRENTDNTFLFPSRKKKCSIIVWLLSKLGCIYASIQAFNDFASLKKNSRRDKS